MLLNGPSSYCKWWQSPPVCLYGDQPCGDVNTCEAPIVGSTTFDLDDDQHGGASAACDSYCQELNGEESYCKHWQNPAVCHSGDQPCGPAVCDPISTTATTPITTSIGSTTFTSTSSTGSAATTAAQSSTPTTVIVSTTSASVSAGPSASSTTGSLVFGGDSDATTSESTECDSYCKFLNGDDSYCKSWLSPAVCQGGDQPCGSSQCAFTSTEPAFGGDADATTAPPSEDTAACDHYCRLLNGELSFCKYWQIPAVCQIGDQPCGDVDICRAPIVGTTTIDLDGDQHADPSPACDAYCQGGDSDTTTTEGPIFGGDADTTTSPSDDLACDQYCKLLNGPVSYCKSWQTPAVCHSGDQPCGDAEICRAPIVGTTTIDLDGDQHAGPSPACDAYCQGLNGVDSYCKYWQNPAVCLSGDQPCGPSVCDPSTTTSGVTSESVSSTVSSEATTVVTTTLGTTMSTTATTPSPTVGGDSETTTTEGPIFGGDADTTTSPSDDQACNHYCKLLNGPESYCKSWQFPAVCQFGDQPCGDIDVCQAPIIGSTFDLVGDQHSGHSSACDSYCQDLNGATSYCKHWQNPAVCLSGDQPCGPSVCDPITSTASSTSAPTSTSTVTPLTTTASSSASTSLTTSTPVFGGDSDSTTATSGCDSYCKSMNDESSYCKFWLNPPVCQGGDQPCGPSVC
ncbi:hypothetical protein FOZ61_002893 [Perkinsus olseni]|uniref:Uncharacterized protein n=1 Tax=Perkinsus olseni TaxID=32597 RepID=A0A7J6MAW1_PEROL|nr:hypothetical protein FOZ61_002893 [Perkinsus olseni]KAF4668527.1 hypothetical protein FOL46_001932 [Perkinsus olseni]